MVPQKSKSFGMMPKGSSDDSVSPDSSPEKYRYAFSNEDDSPEPHPRLLRPLPPTYQPPLPIDVWEVWYVSISIGRPATEEDVKAWRERQESLETQGLQDPTDHSAWLMVRGALRSRGQWGMQNSERVGMYSKTQPNYQENPGNVLYPSPVGYTRLPPEEQERIGTKTQVSYQIILFYSMPYLITHKSWTPCLHLCGSRALRSPTAMTIFL